MTENRGEIWEHKCQHYEEKLPLLKKANDFYSVRFEEVDKLNCDLSISNVPFQISSIISTKNELDILEFQIYYMRKFFSHSFFHNYFDNLQETEESDKLKSICENGNFGYVKLPVPFSKDTSWQHGSCLNWIHYNYLFHKKPMYFGVMDPDMFPIGSIDFLEDYLNDKGFYGIPFRSRWTECYNFWCMSAREFY